MMEKKQHIYIYYLGQFSVAIGKVMEAITGEKISGFLSLDNSDAVLPANYKLLNSLEALHSNHLVIVPSDHHYHKIAGKFASSNSDVDYCHYVEGIIALRQLSEEGQRAKGYLSAQQKNVALLIPTLSVYQKHYQDLPQALASANVNLVIYTLDKSSLPESLTKAFVCIQVCDVINAYGDWDFFDLVISDNCLTSEFTQKLENTKFVYMPHGYVGLCERMLDAHFPIEQTKALLENSIVKPFDLLLLPSRQTFNFFSCLFENEESESTSIAVAAGYKSLDLAIENSTAKNTAENSDSTHAILYSPGALPQGNTHQGIPISFPHFSADIIESLLTAFPDRVIIFRPHPAAISCPDLAAEIASINTKFEGIDNYYYDDKPSHKESFAQSACLVSDTSTSAYTFAFSQLKPVVYFLPEQREESKEISELAIVNGQEFLPLRKHIGKTVSDVQTLVNEVSNFLDNKHEYASQLLAFRQQEFFNVGKVTETMCDVLLAYMKNDKDFMVNPIVDRVVLGADTVASSHRSLDNRA